MATNTQTTLRLMGMTSGMDTDSIIQQMMKLSQMKIDKQTKNKTILEWKQASLNTIKSEISSFRNTFLTTLGSKGMYGSSAYISTAAEVTGKNADAVKITTGTDTTTGTFTIGQVKSLASGAKTESKGASDSGNGFTLSTELKDMVFVDGNKLNFDPDGDGTNDPITLKINDKEITLNANDKLGDFIKQVNESGAGVTMSYDRLNDTFKIESNKKGTDSGAVLNIEDNNQVLGTMGFGSVEASKQAEVEINGQSVFSNNNTFDYRGVNITLNRTTDAGDEETKVNVKHDASAAVSKIKEFVDAYNTIVKKLEGLVKERKTSTEASYTPLTAEEKEAMTEKEIENWEAIAKKGILKNDNGLTTLVTALRGSLFDAIEGVGLNPSDIGLGTGNYFGGTGGQIVLDEEKLTAAFEKDPNKVMNMFAQIPSEKEDEGIRYKQSGLMYRIDNAFKRYLNDYQPLSIESIEESMKRANEQITKLQNKMYVEEERLYKKFAAMETALTNMQSQSSWMSSVMGGA